jgi:hypothetical protein
MTRAGDHCSSTTTLGLATVFTIREQRNQLFATAIVSNTHETIAWLHDSFALLFFPVCLAGTLQIPSGATKGV